MKEEVIRLRTEKAMLRPIHLQRRGAVGSVEERLRSAMAELERRLTQADDARRWASEIESSWNERALELAPGSLVLDVVASRYGTRFSKECGDSARLARLLSRSEISGELEHLLGEIAR